MLIFSGRLLRRSLVRCSHEYTCLFPRKAYSSSADYSLPFTSPVWLINKPKFKHLPNEELNSEGGSNIIPLRFDAECKNIYSENKEFNRNLTNALTLIHADLLNGKTEFSYSTANYSWLRLREYLYQQLKTKQEEKSINEEEFQLTIASLLKPTNPSQLLKQLLCVNQIKKEVWSSILEKQEFTTIDQYYFILKNYFELVRNQELIPQLTPSWSQVDKGLDISNPSEWFPEARKLKRKIIMHVGPTNSGKTYNALQKLKNCPRGYYAGPLRLLAREIYDRFKDEGIRCNLLTGEEVIDDIDFMGNKAGLTSGTVEMIPLNQDFDICVLDEVQMMNDKERGWAWTNAILGVRASEIHLCGEASALPIMEKIVQLTGDTLIVNKYERLGKLQVQDQPLGSGFADLKPGDCVIAFSKKAILDLKLKIEKQTGFKVAVVYGSLPPETRVKQARLFNSGEYNILVASDAIGMGLNLSVKRIVFTTGKKFNGEEIVPLTFSNIKQIGGRAGRYKGGGSSPTESVGYVTAVDNETLRSVKTGIHAPIQYLPSAIVWPTDELIGQLMSYYPPGTKLSSLLSKFAEDVSRKSQKTFELCDLKDKINVISTFEDMPGLTLKDKLRLSNAPVRIRPMLMRVFNQFCNTIAEKNTKTFLDFPLPFVFLNSKYINDENVSLEFYEEFHQIINLYCWLHIRYPDFFVDYESAMDIKNYCEMIIFRKLEFLKKNPYNKFGQQNSGHRRIFRPSSKSHNHHRSKYSHSKSFL